MVFVPQTICGVEGEYHGEADKITGKPEGRGFFKFKDYKLYIGFFKAGNFSENGKFLIIDRVEKTLILSTVWINDGAQTCEKNIKL